MSIKRIKCPWHEEDEDAGRMFVNASRQYARCIDCGIEPEWAEFRAKLIERGVNFAGIMAPPVDGTTGRLVNAISRRDMSLFRLYVLLVCTLISCTAMMVTAPEMWGTPESKALKAHLAKMARTVLMPWTLFIGDEA